MTDLPRFLYQLNLSMETSQNPREENMKKVVALSLALAIGLTPTQVSAAETPTLVSTATIDTISLKTISNNLIAGSVADDAGILLGGLGSDLYHDPKDAKDVFYLITDRGPNNDTVQPDKSAGTGFVVPNFSPVILKVRINGSAVEILESKAISLKSGKGVTGLPNLKGYDAVPTDVKGITSTTLYNIAGLDSEGIVRTRNGEFWVVDEYAPSLARLSKDGVLKTKYVPTNWAGTSQDFTVVKSIPEIFLKRKANRGFEALALSPDERTLFIGLQSPLLNPSTTVGNASLATRILRFDIPTKTFTGEFVFGFEKSSVVDAKSTKNSDLKLSALVALDNETLLVQERTDNSFLLSTIKIKESANILKTKWDLAATTPSLETYAGVGTNAEVEALIAASEKKIVFKSTDIAAMPMKIEGVAVIDANHIVVVNDNDFSFVYNATTGQVDLGTTKTSLLTIKLAAPLPTTPEASLAQYGRKCVTSGATGNGFTCSTSGSELRWK